MGWQEANQKYEDELRLTTCKTEDLIARRVMRGLGYAMPRLKDLERALSLPSDFDRPSWDRVEAVLRAMAMRSGKGWVLGDSRDFPGHFRLETLDADKNRRAIKDLAPVLDASVAPPLPLYFTRITGTLLSKAYFLVGHEFAADTAWLKPPFTVLSEHGQHWLVEQDTEAFVAQFGPYTFGPEFNG